MLFKCIKCNNKQFPIFVRLFSTRNILKLKGRGMFEDIFPDNAANSITDVLNAKPQTVYAGFDPTADSLHIGNLLVLVNLLHWQRGGHNVIALVGGATAKIGDPSGKTTEREELTKVFVDDNVKGIYDNIVTIFENHEKYLWTSQKKLQPIRIVNNESWYNKMTPIELIGKAGRHLRMGTLLSRTSVRSRLQSHVGMSFTEFSYQLFQAYDWFHLLKNYSCNFQIGGSDQMGNLMSGHELISKICKQQVYGLTVPLITSEMGDKFGKSAGNAVWLSPSKTSPFAFYQFWVRQPDSEVERFLKLFTFDSIGSISELMKVHQKQSEETLPQKRLAEQLTLLVHGEEGLKKAQRVTEALYKGSISALGEMKAEEIQSVFSGATVVEVMAKAGQSILDLAMKAGCFPTIEDAVRIIGAGGFYINQQKARNPTEVVNINTHRLQNNVTVIRVGKRNYYIVKWL